MRRATVPPSGQKAWEDVLIKLKSVLTIPLNEFLFFLQASSPFSFKDTGLFFTPQRYRNVWKRRIHQEWKDHKKEKNLVF